MSAIVRIGGRGVPLPGNDIDTDRIIPARFLRCVTFDGLGEHAFADDRRQLKAAGELHPFDNPDYKGASVLVVGSNFGCGSSREHAPQSLQKWGIGALIGISFAEIFFNNNLAIGVPCVCLAAEDIARLQQSIEKDPSLMLAVDLEAQELCAGQHKFSLHMPAGARQMFLHGDWDATRQLLSNLDLVKQRTAEMPYLNGFAF